MGNFFINKDLFARHNKMGIFPYPGEEKENFLQRIQNFYLENKNLVKSKFSFKKLEDLFDIAPDWAQFQYTNRGLRFWEAALLEVKNHTYTLKLKKVFEKKNKYLGLYHKDELIAHECCHLGRLFFNEPKYEEIFAYHTSKGLRRYIGPLFSTSFESLILMCLLPISILSDFMLFLPNWSWFLLKGAPLFYLSFLGIRLFSRYDRFNKCKKKIKKIVKDLSKVLAVMYRLSDNEIYYFSQCSIDEMMQYINQQSEIRWEIIRTAYLISPE